MKDEKGQTTIVKEKRIAKERSHSLLYKVVRPWEWSLRERLIYFPALLLILGILIPILTFYSVQKRSLNEAAVGQLEVLMEWLPHEVEATKSSALTLADSCASFAEVPTALSNGDRKLLAEVVLPFMEKVRVNTNQQVQMRFFQESSKVFFDTADPKRWGGDAPQGMRKNFMGAYIATEGGIPYVFASSLVLLGETRVGMVLVSLPLVQVLEQMKIKHPFGAALLTREISKAEGKDNGQTWRLIKALGTMSPDRIGTEYISALPVRHADGYSAVLPFSEGTAGPEVKILLHFDTTDTTRTLQSGNTIFILLLILGAVFLFLTLLFNYLKIKTFLKQMRKLLIGAHRNDFSERLESDHVHCLEVLQCGNKECPVYQNPNLVCYLETGSEAISPRWRNTCIFLSRYEDCTECPVYRQRIGDEFIEMRNVANTMLRLWREFLDKTSHLFAEVLRNPQIQKSRLSLDDISTTLEQMAKLTTFGHDAQGSLEEDEVYNQLGYIFKDEFDLETYLIFEVRDKDNSLSVRAGDWDKEEALCINDVRMNAKRCRAYRTAEEVSSYHNAHLCPHFNIDHGDYFRCCLPMVMGGRVGAVFSFVAPKQQWAKRSQQISMLRKYLDQCAPVLSSLSLLKLSQEQALRDPLTKCHNRRFLDEYLVQYEPLSKREKKNVGFLMADLDFFKQVNDEHGHQSGDIILKDMVTVMRQQIRNSDLLVRYGGEEFLVVLPDVQPDFSEQVAEKIRRAVELQTFVVQGGVTLKKTLSIGVAEFPNDADAMYKAIKFADVALYAAKQTGRNKVVRFKPEMWVGESY